MRIAYISADHGIPVLGGKGASVHIQKLINGFSDLGHDVHLMAARLGTGTELIYADVTKIRVAYSNSPLALASQMRVQKEQRYVDIGKAAEQVLLEQHSAQPYDMIYERYSLWSAAGVRVARKIGIPVIVEVNAPLLLEQQRYRKIGAIHAAEKIEREVFEQADRLAVVSKDLGAYVKLKGAPADCVEVIPNGVDPAEFNPAVEKTEWNEFGDDPVIGFTGSLKPWHGLQDLLEAFVQVQKRHTSARLLIVGDGPLRAWIEGFVQGARLCGNVIITGWMPHDKLPGLIARMDVAVAPYPMIDDFYFSPLKLFEYMGVGRPIVASAIGQVTDIIKDGVNGLLNRPGDVDHIAQRIGDLLESPSLRYRLGKRAAGTAKNYTWKKNAQSVVDLTRNLMLTGERKVS